MSDISEQDYENYGSARDQYYQILGDQPLNHQESQKSYKGEQNIMLQPFLNLFLSLTEMPNQTQDDFLASTKKLQQCDALKKQINLHETVETQQDKQKFLKNNSASSSNQSNLSPITKICDSEEQIYLRNQKRGKKLGKFILRQVPIKKITHKVATSKFFMRIFLKYQSLFPICKDGMKDCFSNFTELPQMNKKKVNMQKDIYQTFSLGGQTENAFLSLRNRKVLRSILNKHLKSEIILNSFTQKNRLSYMIASKVYALRTQSKELVKKATFR